MKPAIIMAAVALAIIAAVFASGSLESLEEPESKTDRYERAIGKAKDDWRRRIAENTPE